MTRASEVAALQGFVAWLPAAPPSGHPGHVFAAYAAWLVAGGLPEREAFEQIVLVMNGIRTRGDIWRTIFNAIYAREERVFTTEPNALLASAIAGRRPGRALDVGMGEGRNAVYLARQGWDVTGVEVSDEGVAIADRAAEGAGVRITSVLASVSAFDYGVAQWDLVVAMYTPFALTEPAYVAQLRAALRPGGLVVIESTASDADASFRRPIDIDPSALRRAFDGFRIVRFEDTVAVPDWGPDALRLVRLVAERNP
jgi:SAM-dependent methyltransferase